MTLKLLYQIELEFLCRIFFLCLCLIQSPICLLFFPPSFLVPATNKPPKPKNCPTPGYVGSLTIDIPWKQLFPTPKKPVVAHVSDIFIVLGPNLDQEYNAEVEKKLAESAKASAINAWKEQVAARKASQADSKAKASFTEKLVASIINNIQVGCTFLSTETLI